MAFDGADDLLRNADQIVGGNAFTLFTVAKISPLTSPYPYAFGETVLARIGYEGPPFTPLSNGGFDVFHDFGNDARATLTGLSDGNAKIVTISGSGTMSSIQVWGGWGGGCDGAHGRQPHDLLLDRQHPGLRPQLRR